MRDRNCSCRSFPPRAQHTLVGRRAWRRRSDFRKNSPTTESGREALTALKDGSDFDLVFSDLRMPEMDGSELVRAIRADAKLSRLPVYLVTADVEARRPPLVAGFTNALRILP